MENQQTQLTPEEAKASLGIATFLQDSLMPKGSVDGSTSIQNGTGQEQTPQNEPTAPQEDIGAKMADMELNMNKKLDEIRQEMKTDNQREIDGIKQTIKDALNE